MIASPGDVQEERKTLINVIQEWNAINAYDRKIFLQPIAWEHDAMPEFGIRPQEAINKQILDQCDFLIGIFWTRLGSDTGRYLSGTVEEIERHAGNGKPVMLYFSDVPYSIYAVDQQQVARVIKFRNECEKKGLIETYKSLSEFREKVAKHINMATYRHPIFKQKI